MSGWESILAYVKDPFKPLTSAIKYIVNSRRRARWAKSRSRGVSGFGYFDIDFRDYYNLKWLLRYPNAVVEAGTQSDYWKQLQGGKPVKDASTAAQKLQISGPYCPRCMTELREENNYLLWLLKRKYLLQCPNTLCGFKRRNRKSASELRDDVDRVFVAKLREAFENGDIKRI